MSAAVTRFCFVRLRDDDAARRDALARELADELTRLCAPHPVWVGVPGDESAARWDLAITIALPELAAWTSLAGEPTFAARVRRLSDEAEVVKAWTFAAPTSG
ncbi:MAG: hypothetical protein R3B48_10030 [Kofleriaceae bacterium]